MVGSSVLTELKDVCRHVDPIHVHFDPNRWYYLTSNRATKIFFGIPPLSGEGSA